MLDICTAYANSNNKLFNPNKSHCLHFDKSANPIKQFPVELQGVMLIWTVHIVHLGHILYTNLDNSCDIDARRHDFCSQVNYFIACFSYLALTLKIRLFQTYCQSFYCSQIWDLNNNKINTFNVSWLKAVRRLWFVPYLTHRFLLPDLILGKGFLKIITIRFISFANSCFTSLNAKISFIAHVVCKSPLHSLCNNLHLAYNMFAHNNPLCQDHTTLSNVLCELLFVRNCCFNISIFSSSDINDLITNIFCN